MDIDSIKQRALDILLSGKELTNLDGYRMWRTLNLRNRISELRQEGYPITDETVTSDDGKHYKKYWITSENILKLKAI